MISLVSFLVLIVAVNAIAHRGTSQYLDNRHNLKAVGRVASTSSSGFVETKITLQTCPSTQPIGSPSIMYYDTSGICFLLENSSAGHSIEYVFGSNAAGLVATEKTYASADCTGTFTTVDIPMVSGCYTDQYVEFSLVSSVPSFSGAGVYLEYWTAASDCSNSNSIVQGLWFSSSTCFDFNSVYATFTCPNGVPTNDEFADNLCTGPAIATSTRNATCVLDKEESPETDDGSYLVRYATASCTSGSSPAGLSSGAIYASIVFSIGGVASLAGLGYYFFLRPKM